MKTNHHITASLGTIAITLLAGVDARAQTRIPAIPYGTLSAYPTVVRTGTNPTLTWAATYPSNVSDLLTIVPPGILIPKQTSYMSVQPIGTKALASTTQGASVIPAEARLSLNGAPYQQLFYGTQSDVNPAYSLYIKKVYANNTITFGGRSDENGVWNPFYTSHSSNMQVIALTNGSKIPTSLSLYQSSNLASFLKPYVNASGKINIGPLSVIVMMELGGTDQSVNNIDYQDMVLLVTFNKKHPNNGHGNNLDGVDSSNPGKGGGGPNGQVDPSGGVDDEKR